MLDLAETVAGGLGLEHAPLASRGGRAGGRAWNARRVPSVSARMEKLTQATRGGGTDGACERASEKESETVKDNELAEGNTHAAIC